MLLANFQRLVNWFVPGHMKDDLHVRKRVQMFIISHLFGPLIATPIPVFLWFADPQPVPQVLVLALSIYGFWPFLALLRLLPRGYTVLAMLSVLNLTFCILWGTYHYGGTSSPFLVWLVLVPLLAFMYLGSTWIARIFVLGQIVLALVALYAVYLLDAYPVHIPVENMVVAGLLSALGANIYVFMMSAYYSSVVDSQSELIREIERHQATLYALTNAKNEAERANGAKSDFLARMSHELRTPLNAVLGYSEILLEDAELDGRGEQIADLQKISAAGKHLLSMVNDILDISKIEAGKMMLHVETLSLDKLLDEVEATARPLAAKNANSFVVQRGANLGLMRGDGTKLRQAIFNLLSNAAKFTQNGTVVLSVQRVHRDGEDWLAIAVTDTGIGISKTQQQALFSSFTQADPRIGAVYGGTGLGLSLSQNLVQLMGGSIGVESELAAGSRFTIEIPANADHVLPRAVTLDPEPAEDDRMPSLPYAGGSSEEFTPRERLLFVDDDHKFLELAERMFFKEGYAPICTDAPRSALQFARTMKPAAVFLDILMPGFDGWDVLAALKADPVTADIPVFMISVLSEKARALAAGADGVVLKPIDVPKVRQAIEDVRASRTRRSLPRAVNH